jgi:uncharacterized OB-fold protein
MSALRLPDSPPRLDSPVLQPFWDALDQGELKLPACSKCGAWQWYPYAFVKCHADAVHDWRAVPTTGVVFTHTTVQRSLMPDGDQTVTPYVSALVELDGVEGPRLATLLVNLDGRQPSIGMRVRFTVLQGARNKIPAFEPLD